MHGDRSLRRFVAASKFMTISLRETTWRSRFIRLSAPCREIPTADQRQESRHFSRSVSRNEAINSPRSTPAWSLESGCAWRRRRVNIERRRQARQDCECLRRGSPWPCSAKGKLLWKFINLSAKYLTACSASSSDVACCSFVFSSLNLSNKPISSACSSNSLREEEKRRLINHVLQENLGKINWARRGNVKNGFMF